MSKKNLARTALEAGRLGGWQRKHLNRTDRRRVRDHLRKVEQDPEFWDDSALPQPPKPGYDDMIPGENLNAVYRWIDSHVSYKWDDVYSKLCKNWPKKTLAGYHIIEDHIKGEVQKHPVHDWTGTPGWWARWYVDDHGVLQRNPQHSANKPGWKSRRKKERAQYPDGDKWTQKRVSEWLGGRMVRHPFYRFDWYWVGNKVRKLGSEYFFIDTEGRQGRKLTNEEVQIWESIYPWIRAKFESNLEGEE